MNNPETTRSIHTLTEAKPIEEGPPFGPSRGAPASNYSDSANGFPLAAGKQIPEVATGEVHGLEADEDASAAEVAAARIGAAAFSCLGLPALLWASSALGATAAVTFAAASAVLAFRILLAEPGKHAVLFLSMQALVAFAAVWFRFGVPAAVSIAFLAYPAGLLAAATLFGRFARNDRRLGDADRAGKNLVRAQRKERPDLHVVPGRAQSHSA